MTATREIMSENSTHPNEEQKHKDQMEGVKLFFDFSKHLATISTGSLLLLATLLEKFFRAPSWRALILAAFAGFFVSVTCSAIAMFSLAHSLHKSGEPGNEVVIMGASGLFFSVSGFLIGAISLVVFTLRNFYA